MQPQRQASAGSDQAGSDQAGPGGADRDNASTDPAGRSTRGSLLTARKAVTSVTIRKPTTPAMTARITARPRRVQYRRSGTAAARPTVATADTAVIGAAGIATADAAAGCRDAGVEEGRQQPNMAPRG